MPLGRSSASRRNCSFKAAHRAIAVGPPAPANTANMAMTTTLTNGCCRLTVERGSSSSAKCGTTSSRVIRLVSAMVGSLCGHREVS